MKHIGNLPSLEILSRDSGIADYVSMTDPAVDTNPSQIPASWLNMATGEMFYCIDNTPGANVWKGQLGTSISGV